MNLFISSNQSKMFKKKYLIKLVKNSLQNTHLKILSQRDSLKIVASEKFDTFQLSQKQKENNRDLKRFFKQTFEQLRIKSCDYIKYYISFFTCIKRKKMSQVIDYGLQKLYNHLDIVFILNKLIEFQKLQKLLLNENQLRLFDYILKPIIKVDKNNNQVISDYMSESSNLGIFYENKKTLIQKAEDAQEAYNNIINQSQQNTEINQKLINLLHPKLIELFNMQSFEKPDCQKDKFSLRIKRNQFTLQIPQISPKSNLSEKQLFQSPQRDKTDYQQSVSNNQFRQFSVRDIQLVALTCQNKVEDLNGNQVLSEYELYQSSVRDNYNKYSRILKNSHAKKLNLNNQ